MHVVVAVDGSTMAERILAHSAPWLRAVGAEVELMTILDASELHGTLTREGGAPAREWADTAASGGYPVVSVMPASSPAPRVVEYESQAIEDARATRLAALERLAETYLPGLETHFLVEDAEHTADEILRVARETAADAITIGTHGRTGLRRLLMGSIAEGVIRRARVLVLVVPASDA